MDTMNGYDSRPRWQLLIAATVSSAMILAAAATASGASSEPCRVKNTESGVRYSRLQPAVAAAAAGDRVVVRGTCRGTSTVDRDLVIAGIQTTAWGRARLEGNRVGAFVLTVEPGVTLTLESTTIWGNRADRDGNGGGLLNRGTTTLKSARVRGPSYGTAVSNEGSLTVRGSSDIGNVDNKGQMTLRGESSMDGRRKAYEPISAGIYNTGRLTLDGRSSVVDSRSYGVFNYGTVTLNDESRILRNGRSGIYNRGSVVMHDKSRIAYNGSMGIYIQKGGTLTMSGRSRISNNTAARGAGVFLRKGTLTMRDGSRIRYNRARIEGGGLYIGGQGTLVGVRCGQKTSANVRNNKPQNCVFE